MESSIELLEINKLIGKNFDIPSYQRGYRWDTKQVEDLLNDLWEFMQKPNKKDEEFYCLQPIVVAEKAGLYEVIDGQQRLTTIYIILKFLDKKTYSIKYATRPTSKDVLENIAEYATDHRKIDNIDFYFFKNAYLTIKSWFENKEKETEEYTLQDEFNICLGKKTKVIWYEVSAAADVENIFTRLNIGKIQLTNAELIKALFLCSDNFSNNKEITHLHQLEIANEWDQIECSLQKDGFWYFINGTETNLPTRIEYIFDAISERKSNDDEFFTFIHFSKSMAISSSQDLWFDIKRFYMILEEWYNDNELYHLIGFLSVTDVISNVTELMSRYQSGISKVKFREFIKGEVRASMKKIYIEDLQYGTDNKSILKVLLLFNVVTTMNTLESRFPFESYVKSKWSLEHIHAQNAEGLNKKEQWISWIDEHISSFQTFQPEKYVKVTEKLKAVDRDKLDFNTFEALFMDISNEISDDYGTDLHSIDNMALLDKDTNSSLNNEFFDAKRKIIIERDRAGRFIPICTRNVFLKYYSTEVIQIHYWSESDRRGYFINIETILKEYLDKKEEE